MIRKATLDDIPAIRSMAGVVFPATYREILSPAQIAFMMDMMYSEQSLLSQMTSQNNVFYIIDGKGYVSFRPKDRSTDDKYIFQIEKLYVMPQFQGTGLGRELLNAAINAAKSSSPGDVIIELNVNRFNPAVSFYEHIGMHKDRSVDIPIGKGFYMNDFVMVI